MAPRSFTRVPVHIRASIRTVLGDTAEGTVRDLSLNGLSIGGSHTLTPGSEITIRLHLEGAGLEVPVHAAGTIARNDGKVLAARIERVEADDLEHFTKLLLYNAPDAAAFEAELSLRGDVGELAGRGRSGNVVDLSSPRSTPPTAEP